MVSGFAPAPAANPYPHDNSCRAAWFAGHTVGVGRAFQNADAVAFGQAQAAEVAGRVRSHAIKQLIRIAYSEGVKSGAEQAGARVVGDPRKAGMDPKVDACKLVVYPVTPVPASPPLPKRGIDAITARERIDRIGVEVKPEPVIRANGDDDDFDYALAEVREDQAWCAMMRAGGPERYAERETVSPEEREWNRRNPYAVPAKRYFFTDHPTAL